MPEHAFTSRLATLLESLRQSDIDALPAAQRERLGAQLQRWADRCAAPQSSPPGDGGVEVEDWPDA